MGLLYSITQTLYSYIYPSNTTPISAQKIHLFSKKLILGMQHRINTLKMNNFKLQLDFVQKVNTQKKRDKFNESILIDHMIMEAIKCGVYEQLLNSTKRIDFQAQNITKGLDKVSQQCITSIFAIVHLYKDFQLFQFIDLKEFLPEPYPVIGMDKLDDNIRRYLKFKQPTQNERNKYVIQMCKRHEGKISVVKLNQANHGFSQYPELNDKQQNEFDSIGLYARSASIQVDQEKYQQLNKYDQREMDSFAA